ncbi:GDSL-type esterase/lipase family protein [Paenibacillus tarimensis]|uniref:GDSL-type esterase/lipase family protein n=1 Tax=Paenibacillus tarimensis TaxID=416012 RepID=UPI001F172019|nr:GDSL-type esterase/lipase family protein [Paenibacillus tarimensis]MCF2942618.1 GDSL-type esterase/lipase family protein [Paenibacillus tarimensis]
MSSRKVWLAVGLVSLASTVLLLAGFGYAVRDLLAPGASVSFRTEAPEPAASPVPAEGYRIVALGDSLTKGTGDATGEGYVKQAAALLEEASGKQVEIINNLAIGGMRADQLSERLNEDKSFARALTQANLILLSIGGNDLFQFARTGTGSGAAVIDLELASKRLEEGLSRLSEVIERIREVNADAKLVYIGLYNPFYDIPELRSGSLAVQDWNREAFRILHEKGNAVLVPTSDLFEETIAFHLSSDHFHPNHAGYGKIAERLVQSLVP